MKRVLLALIYTLLGVLLAGCATPTIRSEVTAFHDWPANQQYQNVRYMFERSKEQENNLEYRNYENLVRAELNRLGFREAADSKSADVKVSLSYDIKVRDVRIIEPVLVNPYWYGPAWRGYYGPFYDPFWFGPPMVERRDVSYQLFTRELKIVLARASDGKRLQEITVVSEGTNGSLAAVMPYMVRAAFADFPGKSGLPRRVELKMDQ